MNKKELYKTAVCVFAVLLLAFVFILIYIPAEKNKTKKIAVEIQRVLDESDGGYIVEENLLLKTPAQTSMYAFTILNSTGRNSGYAYLVRITGICGPVPAVFVGDEQNNMTFVGIAGLNGFVPQKEKVGLTDMLISHWMLRIRNFMENREE